MTIAQEKFIQGHVIAQLFLEISKINDIRLSIENSVTRAGYCVSLYQKDRLIGKFGLFIKSSGKRRSPWNYTFTRDHQTEIELLFEEYKQVFIVLVNNTDGVASLSYQLLKQILDDNHEDVEWVSVKSKLSSRYSLSGKDGELDKKISRSDFPKAIGLYVRSLSSIKGTQDEDKLEYGILARLFGR